MSNVTVRRRKDGVQQIARDDGALPAGERHLAAAVLFFLSFGLFLSDLVPFFLVLGVVGACMLGETMLLPDAWARLRRPVAEVHDLAEARWQRRWPG